MKSELKSTQLDLGKLSKSGIVNDAQVRGLLLGSVAGAMERPGRKIEEVIESVVAQSFKDVEEYSRRLIKDGLQSQSIEGYNRIRQVLQEMSDADQVLAKTRSKINSLKASQKGENVLEAYDMENKIMELELRRDKLKKEYYDLHKDVTEEQPLPAAFMGLHSNVVRLVAQHEEAIDERMKELRAEMEILKRVKRRIHELPDIVARELKEQVPDVHPMKLQEAAKKGYGLMRLAVEHKSKW